MLKMRYALATLLAVSVGWLAFSSEADARPNTKSYTCSGVQNLVSSRGAIVLNTKNSSVFERFVANQSFCQRNEKTKLISVPTKSGTCRLNVCYEPVIWNM